MSRRRASRSVSGDLDQDSDGDLGDDNPHNDEGASGQAPGKPGRKKNPNSQAARRDQNRIAQREFRLRKQQRIRDLEARVEILSGSKDETYVQMRDIIRELIAENQTLRNMLRGLSAFIGDGAGGALPSLGWTLKDFEAFINKAETDTAFEAYAKRRKAMQDGLIPSTASTAEKRSASDDPSVSRKRVRTDSTNGSFEGTAEINFGSGVENAFSSSYSSEASTLGLYPNIRPSPSSAFNSTFLNSLASDPHGPNSFLSGPTPSPNLPYPPAPTTANGRETYSSSFQSGTTTNSHSPAGGSSISQPTSFLPSSAGSNSQPAQNSPVEIGDPSMDDPKAQEARKLVGYHLENFRRNSAYCLPPSLRPTLVQRTVEHESIIDGIPHPEVRNRMILLRGRFNLADCIHGYLTSTTIHGDDVLAHANWEIQESWLKQYGFLIDAGTLTLTNRWRKERGAPEIVLSDIAPSEQLPGIAP